MVLGSTRLLSVAAALITLSSVGCKRRQVQTPSALKPPSAPQGEQKAEKKFEFNDEQAQIVVNSTTKIVEKEFKEENSHLKYRNAVSFPQFDGSINDAQRRFNEAVRQRARKEFEEYRRQQLLPRSQAERFPRHHEDVEEFLQVAYDVPFVNEKLVSVRFYASTYGRGAAHAVDYFFVFNYDLESERELSLPDLFLPSSHYLNLVSDYSRQVVTEKLCGDLAQSEPLDDCLKTDQLFEEGIDARPKNFKSWSITRGGILFSFDPCQFAGCAAGEFYVLVPYSKIKPVLKSGSVVEQLLD